MDIMAVEHSSSGEEMEHMEEGQIYSNQLEQGLDHLELWENCFVRPEMPITLEIKHLNYHVKVKTGPIFRRKTVTKKILDDINIVIRPGEMCGILGPTGAGKTSLLNVLAGRIRQNVEGEILFNGHPFSRKIKKKTAFVLQEDIFFSRLKALDTLELTAKLILPKDMSRKQKVQRANDMLDMFRLRKAANTIIGDQFKRGLSGGEKKRLNIANELMNTEASVLMMDEPTSGLDAQTALEVCRLMKNLATYGKTVMCTLHQPSSQVFEMFDRLLLLADGKVCFFGSPQEVIPYFSRIGFHCPINYNPADFLLTLLHDENREKVLTYRKEHVEEVQKIEKLLTEEEEQALVVKDMGKKTGYPTTWPEQFYLLLMRGFKQHVAMIIPQGIIFAIMAVISCIVWFQLPMESDTIQNRYGLMFFISVQWFIFPMFSTMNSFIPEKGVVRKERQVGMYYLSSYFLGKACAELFLDFITPFLFVTAVYWITGLNHDPFYRYLRAIVITFCAFLSGQSLGLSVAALFDDVRQASFVAMVYFFLSQMTAGFFVSIDQIPSWFRWTRFCSPLYYLFQAALVNEFQDAEYEITDDGTTGVNGDLSLTYSGTTAYLEGNSILEGNDVTFESVFINVAIALCFMLGFRVFAYLVLRRTTNPIR